MLDPAGLIAPFCDSTGGYLPLLCVMNATGVLHEVARLFPREDLETLTRAAERVQPGCEGLVFLPFLQGERVPDLPLATGSLLGLRPGLLQPGHLFRAALEGVSLNLAWGVERMRALGLAIEELRLVGGGARNALWAQILADVLGARVRRLAENESAALGAALQAAWIVCRGSLDALVQGQVALLQDAILPQPESVACYRQAQSRFQDAVRRLHGA